MATFVLTGYPFSMSQQTDTFVLHSARMISTGVRHLSFVREDGAAFPYTPGQFITLHFEAEGRVMRRSYSIASIPGIDERIDFAASYVEGGVGTALLFDIKPGQTVQASGPYGRLVLRDEPVARYILIGTGTGITPYRSMLPELERRAREADLRVVIFQGVQSRDDLLYGDDFIRYAERNPEHFNFQAYYSRRQPSNSGVHERAGHVQVGFPELGLNPASDIIYLCGNPNMIDQAFAYFQEQGFASGVLRREKYISSK